MGPLQMGVVTLSYSDRGPSSKGVSFSDPKSTVPTPENLAVNWDNSLTKSHSHLGSPLEVIVTIVSQSAYFTYLPKKFPTYTK